MIKAEDLRIGDLVRVKVECTFEKGTIGKVTDICSQRQHKEKKGIVVLEPIGNDSSSCGIWCCNIGGIPLTSKILEKNGFEMREDSVVYARKRVSLKPLGDGSYQVGLGSLRFFYVKVNVIKYVHELQNILCCIKGDDANLTI